MRRLGCKGSRHKITYMLVNYITILRVYMSRLKSVIISTLTIFLYVCSIASNEVVKKIIIEGNERLPDSSVIAYCPIKKGEVASSKDVSHAIEELYASKQFSKIKVSLSQNILTIQVVEKPIIRSIEIKHNKLIPEAAINDILEKANLVEGQVFDPVPLQEIKFSLLQSYKLQGYQDVEIEETFKEISGNQVKVTLNVKKKKQFQVGSVMVYGNKAFSKKDITQEMGLGTPSWYTVFFGGNYYSDLALKKGMVDLKKFYDDHGYLEFKVADYEVVPSKSAKVSLNMHLDEGPLYTISELAVDGDATIKDMSFSIINKSNAEAAKGDYPFSRKLLEKVRESITSTLEQDHYPIAEIETKFDLDEAKHQVRVTFTVIKGQPKTIRFIEFEGNTYTLDKVLRREMAISEGELFTHTALEESKRRIANLSYLKDIRYTISPVPGKPSQVDVLVHVEETPSATANMDLGYNEKEGVIASAGLTHPNFLGTGNQVNVKLERSSERTTAALNGFVPFVFNNGVGVGYNIQYDHQTKNSGSYTAQQSYSSDTYGAGLNANIPLSIYQSISLGGEISLASYSNYDNAPPGMRNYIANYGDEQWKIKLRSSWKHSTLNKAILPSQGSLYSANLNLGLPLGDDFISYYTLHSNAAWFMRVGTTDYIINPKLHFAIGNGFKDITCLVSTGSGCEYSDLPLPEKFFGGATEPVRGIMTFGDKFMGDAIGGDLLTTASLNLFLPQFAGEAVQLSAFIDGGYIYNQHQFDFSEWTYSAGIQARIQTPMAPIILMYATPIKIDSADKGEVFKNFQFSFQTALY